MRLMARAARGIVAMSGWDQIRPVGTSRVFTGQKFAGSMAYPSTWDFDSQTLRMRSRQAHYESPEGRALLGRLANAVIGSGLMLESAPAWNLIDPQNKISADARRNWVKDVQTRFNLWASSTDADITGRKTFYQLQKFEFVNRLKDGETFPVLRQTDSLDNPLQIQFLDPDQVMSPYTPGLSPGARLIEGVELDEFGAEVAIHVQDPTAPAKFQRFPMSGDTRRFVLHPALIENVGQVRGMPLLAPFVHELQKITDYSVAELEAAVLNACIAGWVEPSQEANSSRPMAAGNGPVRKGSGTTQTTSTTGGDRETSKGAFMDKPGLWIQNLKAGEKFNSYDTKRPNVNFGDFVQAVMKSVSAALQIPIEVLYMAFGSNYSASRASIVMFWNVVETWRYDSAAEFLGPVFEQWLDGEIAAGRISAAGWNVPILRRAWKNANWTGLSKPSIDPLKEAKAAQARVVEGHSTREFEALQYNGSDFHANVDRLADENQRLAEARMPLVKLENTVFNGVDSDGNPLTADPTKTPSGASA